jgi:hypothetical protein
MHKQPEQLLEPNLRSAEVAGCCPGFESWGAVEEGNLALRTAHPDRQMAVAGNLLNLMVVLEQVQFAVTRLCPRVDTDFRFVDTACSAAMEQRPGRRLYASEGLQPRLFDNAITVSHCDHEHSDGRIRRCENFPNLEPSGLVAFLKGDIPSFTVRWDEKGKAQ